MTAPLDREAVTEELVERDRQVAQLHRRLQGVEAERDALQAENERLKARYDECFRDARRMSLRIDSEDEEAERLQAENERLKAQVRFLREAIRLTREYVDPGRCHGDWQGPNDDECVDDLLVIPCENPPSPDRPIRCGRIHRGHHPDTGQVVRWVDVAGTLFDSDGEIVRRQFTPEQETAVYAAEAAAQAPTDTTDEEESVVHQCPPGDSNVTPCCGRTPFELPLTDRMTLGDGGWTCGRTTDEEGHDG